MKHKTHTNTQTSYSLDDFVCVFRHDSSVVTYYSYDPRNGSLLVNYKNGSRYLYKSVPFAVFMELFTAESLGKAMNEKVKNNYEYTKLGA